MVSSGRQRSRSPLLRAFAAQALACGLLLGPSPLQAQTSALVSTFDAAWRILRANYVVETRSHLDWDAIRAELRPKAEAAGSADEVRAVIQEMLERVGQSHFAVLPAPLASELAGTALPPGEVGSVGFSVAPVNGALVVTRVEVTGPAAGAGVSPGWIVSRVGHQNVSSVLGAGIASEPRQRDFQAWALGTGLLRGRAGQPTTIAFVDGEGRTVTRTIVREPERGQPVTLGHLPTLFARLDAHQLVSAGKTLGIIRFNVWMTPVSRLFDQAVDTFRDADGMVIDLRGNPGGVLTMIMGLSGHFVPGPIALGTIRTRDSELKLIANPRLVAADGRPVRPFTGPVAILVDSGSYSASEIFSAGMQSIGRARVFGSRTAGGALPAVLEQLPGGDVLQYAIGDFVTVAGDRIEGRGVVPDEVVVPTRGDLLAGRDPVLERAIDWIVKGPEHP